jgi:hypothetical protein
VLDNQKKPYFMTTPATCFAKKGDYVDRSIAGDTIIVPIRGHVGDLNSIYNLNDVGTFIWKLIDGRTTVSQIVQAVHSEFEVTAEAAETDTLEFVGALESAGMVEPIAPSA